LYKQLIVETKTIIEEITNIYKQVGVERIILFGSQAYGIPTSDSDIDLIIVVPYDKIPSTHREKMDIYLYYNQFIKKYKKIIPIDLIVYTIPAFNKFKELNSSFSQEVINKGIILYEANNKGVA